MPGAISENALFLRPSKPSDEPNATQAPAESASPGSSSDRQTIGRAYARLGNVTIRLTLLSLIVGLLVTSGAAINAVWFAKSRETTEESRDQFFAFFARSMAQRTSDLLTPAIYALREHQIEARRGLLNVDDPMDLGKHLAEQLRAHPRFDELYHALAATGQFVGAWQPIGDTVVLSKSDPSVDGGAFSEWTVYSDGTLAQYRRDLQQGYDARNRVWFKLAAAQPDDRLVWTKPYMFFRTQRPGITAAQAWRLPGERQPRGVFAADFSLDGLANFLNESIRIDGARSFLVTRQGQIVVSSKMRRGDPDDRIWQAIEQALPESIETLRVNKPVEVAASYAGVDYIGVMQIFRIEGGLEWAIVSIVPKARFFAASIQNTKRAAAVGLVVMLAAIGLGWLISERVARPLRQITTHLNRIGQFDFTPEPAPKSFVHEIMVVSNGIDRMKTSLRSFGHYVPVDLVREVIASGKEASLGGETRELTLLASDVAGFTAISERLPPNALVAQLGEYLDAMSDAIRAEGGTIDKYIGDGIIAFFNAPRLLSMHPVAACRAALAAEAAVLALQERWEAAGQPAFPTRIGLHTGEVLVGNIGTPERFAYTAMGDAMNLASRLEGLNKVYGTRLLASEAVWGDARGEFEWRRLDRVAVVGREQGTLLFELLGRAGELPQALLDARDCYEAALDAYFARRFSEAMAGFARAGRLRPGDGAADVMDRRTLSLTERPPDREWDGAFVSQEK